MSGSLPWWLDRLAALDAAGAPAVLVTVAAAFGSSPREASARMIVTSDRLYGTIGGGNLEYRATAEAREMLAGGVDCVLKDYPLGPALEQCCGGYVKLHYERIAPGAAWVRAARAAGPDGVLVTDTASSVSARRIEMRHGNIPEAGKDVTVERLSDDRPLVLLFGAGHVGRALAPMLAAAACRVRWIDSREDLLTGVEGVETVAAADPAAVVQEAPTGAWYLVMTHSHRLDEDICTAVLQRGDFSFLGLIGSATKRARFEARFREAGIPEATIARLTCPIGIGGITSKQPGAVAVATAAQVLERLEALQAGDADRQLEQSA